MPRRPPRKPPAELDLSRHLLPVGSLPDPLEPASLFSRRQPVELEVGVGKGMFLAAATAANPGRNYLGIEVSGGYARLAAGKLAAGGIPNGIVVHGDGMRLVSGLLTDQSVIGVHVYFPDPWWKARHRKRRILNPVFLQHTARILPPGEPLHVWTDVEEYFNETVAATAATGLFEPPADEPPGGPQSDYRTHFERRTRLAGAPVWRAIFRRNQRPATVARVITPPVSPAPEAAE